MVCREFKAFKECRECREFKAFKAFGVFKVRVKFNTNYGTARQDFEHTPVNVNGD